jgi:hypothetical protein
MDVTRAILLVLLPLAHYVSGSFYDNPEVVLTDQEKISTIDEAAKWDFDVSQQSILHLFLFATSNGICSGLLQAYLPSLI